MTESETPAEPAAEALPIQNECVSKVIPGKQLCKISDIELRVNKRQLVNKKSGPAGLGWIPK